MTKKSAKEQKLCNYEDLPIEVLTPAEMGRADSITIETGTAGYDLMVAAGRAVADKAMTFRATRILVLAGPGNNGGDGLVAARMLAEAGRTVRVALLGQPEKLSGDAATAYSDYTGALHSDPVETLDPDQAGQFDIESDLIIDALFGAGLTRGLAGGLAELAERANQADVPILAVDLPSGVDGATGEIAGQAFNAQCTVTFFRLKPGHLLYPGRAHCGETHLAQIGIAEPVLRELEIGCLLNTRSLWQSDFPRIAGDAHKYTRGHALVVSGPWVNTGAARLAARAALRSGAGLVTVAADTEAARVHATHLTAIMIRDCNGAADISTILEDARFKAVAIGPAAGLGEKTCNKVMACLGSEASVVLDADALMSFAEDPAELFQAIRARSAPVILTPHAGEFTRLFPDCTGGGKLRRAGEAVARSGATVVFKGPDTVVADPTGQRSVGVNAPPWLATAGSGDVLAGIIAGLLAQGMSAFQAASAAVWMHGQAATAYGPGLIADDLPDQLPAILRSFCILDD